METDKVLELAKKAGGVKLSLEFETWKITEPGLLRFAALIQREMEAENAELRKDAERYVEWRSAFRNGECALYNALCDAQTDSEHDAAIDSARNK